MAITESNIAKTPHGYSTLGVAILEAWKHGGGIIPWHVRDTTGPLRDAGFLGRELIHRVSPSPRTLSPRAKRALRLVRKTPFYIGDWGGMASDWAKFFLLFCEKVLDKAGNASLN
jgi:hypothetical protein